MPRSENSPPICRKVVLAAVLLVTAWLVPAAHASTNVVSVYGTSTCISGTWTLSIRLTDQRISGDLVDAYNTDPAVPVKLADSVPLTFGVPLDPAFTFSAGRDRKVTVDVVPHGALASAHIGESRGVRPDGCAR
jgi:hypothetical protein